MTSIQRDFDFTLLYDDISEEDAYEFLRDFSIQSSRKNDRVLNNRYAIGRDFEGDLYAIESNHSDNGEKNMIFKIDGDYREEVL